MTADTASVLWIESEPLSGGSRTQVEFPGEVGTFFGGSNSPAVGEELQIAVTCAGIAFPPKKFDFHHNEVWRLNLPSAREGLGQYRNSILCFERTSTNGRYRLTKVDPDSPLFEILRERAISDGQLIVRQRSDGTDRECGFF
jgi:hypothetical protein